MMDILKGFLAGVLWPSAFEASPAGGEDLSLGDDRIRNVIKATRERLEHEHVKDMVTGTPAQDGWHKPGSAKCYFQTDPPETRPDGVTALTADDNGRVWVHSVNYREYVYHHAAGATPATRWIVRTAILGGDNTFTGNNTFSGGSIFSGDNSITGSILKMKKSSFDITLSSFLFAVGETENTVYLSACAALGLPTLYNHGEDLDFLATGVIWSSTAGPFSVTKLRYTSTGTPDIGIAHMNATYANTIWFAKGSTALSTYKGQINVCAFISRREDDLR